ncbi:MAG TPA: hypothetical protein VMW33_09555, partial [Ilumatobacteraceae bacterium]|nr:hypothetical protein [Ilumatobacteraceae bacterium]
ATGRREFVQSMHHRMGGHNGVAVIDLDGLPGAGDGPLDSAFEHETDQVVGVGKGSFEVVAAPT